MTIAQVQAFVAHVKKAHEVAPQLPQRPSTDALTRALAGTVAADVTKLKSEAGTLGLYWPDAANLITAQAERLTQEEQNRLVLEQQRRVATKKGAGQASKTPSKDGRRTSRPR
jgi:hypothetical protein